MRDESTATEVSRYSQQNADRRHSVSAINQLRAFQNKVRAQAEPLDSALAESLIQSVQQIIEPVAGKFNVR